MQRGQGPGRRRYPLSNRNASARRNRSNPPSTSQEHPTSHSTSSQHRRALSVLRRSARIAESLTGSTNTSQQDPTFSDLMADVARPRPVGGRAVSSRHQDNSTRAQRQSRSGHYTDDIQYAMDFIVQPPRTARVGHTIPGSIIVRLRTTNTYPDDAVVDSPNLMAVAALVPGPSSTASADPNVLNTLLAGQRIDSIHPFADDEADGSIASMDMAGSQGIGYMRFPDLAVRQAGTYRIRITLLRFGAGVQIVDSNPIVVQNAGPATAYASYNGRYTVASC